MRARGTVASVDESGEPTLGLAGKAGTDYPAGVSP